MSVLTHRFDRPFRPSGASAMLRRPKRQLRAGTVRRLLLRIATILSSGIVLTVLIALKTAAYFWRFHS